MSTYTWPKTWSCDECGKPVTAGADDGIVVADNFSDFKLIHKITCDDETSPQSWEVDYLVGPDGLSKLLSFLSPGPILSSGPSTSQVEDFDSYVDLLRRLYIPHYEEARKNFHAQTVTDHYEGANEQLPYTQDELKRIASY